MASLNIVVFLGSVREGRMGIRVAKFIVNLLSQTNHKVTLIDPKEYKLPLVEMPYHFNPDPSSSPAVIKDLHSIIQEADAYVAISAEYNYCISPALTNLMDHFPISDYKFKPCGIVTYSMGSFGGMSAATQLRTFLGGLGMLTPHYMFNIPKVHESFSPEGEALDPRLVKNGNKLIEEILWIAEPLKAHREKAGIPN